MSRRRGPVAARRRGWAAAAAALALALAAAGCGGVKRVEERGPEGKPQPQKPEAPDSKAEAGVPPRAGRPRVPASPEGLLAPGAVGEIQQALEKKGLLRAHRQGELDDATARALERFQEKEGLAATGMPDRETLLRLGISPERAYGREGREEGESRSAAGAARTQ
jgi:hypothetical protein